LIGDRITLGLTRSPILVMVPSSRLGTNDAPLLEATALIMTYNNALCSRPVMPEMRSTKCTDLWFSPVERLRCNAFLAERYVSLLWLVSTRSNSYADFV
jgi:hypothetical protein